MAPYFARWLKMDLYIIRHAQSVNNALADPRHRLCDPPLTEVGWRQAELLARHLAHSYSEGSAHGYDQGRPGLELTRLFCSPMRRALQTAAPLSRALGLPVEVWVEIHEQGGIWLDHGEAGGIVGYPGITRQELSAEFPGYVIPEQITDQGWWHGGYEEMAACERRASQVAGTLLQWAEGNDRIALITHGGFSNVLLRILLGSAGQPVFYHLDNTSVSLLRLRGNGEISVRYLNRIDHLPPELVT